MCAFPVAAAVRPERPQRGRETGRRLGVRQRGAEFLEAQGAIIIRTLDPAVAGDGGCMSNRARVVVGCVLGLLAIGGPSYDVERFGFARSYDSIDAMLEAENCDTSCIDVGSS
jgi:hypothetical protein